MSRQRVTADTMIAVARNEGWQVMDEAWVTTQHGWGTPEWTTKAVRLTTFIANPATEDTAGSVRKHRMQVWWDADGRDIRRVATASGSTDHIGIPKGQMMESITRHGATGHEVRVRYVAESRARHEADRNERTQREAQATMWAERIRDLGVDARPHNQSGQVLVAGEVLHELLAAFEREAPEAFAEAVATFTHRTATPAAS